MYSCSPEQVDLGSGPVPWGLTPMLGAFDTKANGSCTKTDGFCTKNDDFNENFKAFNPAQQVSLHLQ